MELEQVATPPPGNATHISCCMMPCAALQASTDFERQLLRQTEALDQAQGFLRELEQQKVADLENSMQRCASAHAGMCLLTC